MKKIKATIKERWRRAKQVVIHWPLTLIIVPLLAIAVCIITLAMLPFLLMTIFAPAPFDLRAQDRVDSIVDIAEGVWNWDINI